MLWRQGSAFSILSLTADILFSLFFSLLLPISLHFEPKWSPPSYDDNGSIKDFFMAQKPWQRPV